MKNYFYTDSIFVLNLKEIKDASIVDCKVTNSHLITFLGSIYSILK